MCAIVSDADSVQWIVFNRLACQGSHFEEGSSRHQHMALRNVVPQPSQCLHPPDIAAHMVTVFERTYCIGSTLFKVEEGVPFEHTCKHESHSVSCTLHLV